MLSDIEFSLWQKQMAPLLYDSFSHYNVPWPTQACRWGAVLEDFKYKVTCRIYFAEQTDNTEPQKLVCSNVDVCKPRVSSADVVSSWNNYSNCPYIREHKVIFHPGEVNTIRELPQHPHIVVTHTDSPDLFVWNTDSQPNRQVDKGTRGLISDSVAELKLVGHDADALFPMSISTENPTIASGGSDNLVLLWSIQDSMETLLAQPGTKGKEPELQARTRLEGHKDTVSEVCFKPGSAELLVSSAYDELVLFWDTRVGCEPTCTLEQAHGSGQDVVCLDWDGITGHLVVTAAPDGSVSVWDTRKTSTHRDVVSSASAHAGGVIHVEWHPTEAGVFASCGEDRLIMVWRCNGDMSAVACSSPSLSSSLPRAHAPIFQHPGHRRGKVSDFQWCPHESLPWTMLSTSDDSADEELGGGSVQMWRMSELISRDERELLEELEKHGDFILSDQQPPAIFKLDKGMDLAAPAAADDDDAANTDTEQQVVEMEGRATKQRRVSLMTGTMLGPSDMREVAYLARRPASDEHSPMDAGFSVEVAFAAASSSGDTDTDSASDPDDGMNCPMTATDDSNCL